MPVDVLEGERNTIQPQNNADVPVFFFKGFTIINKKFKLFTLISLGCSKFRLPSTYPLLLSLEDRHRNSSTNKLAR